MDKIMADLIFSAKKNEYLKQNPERFNASEKAKFEQDFAKWLSGEKSHAITDEVYDFLINTGLAKTYQPREQEFVSYLNNKYKNLSFRKILDVGAGRMCKLSVALAKYGCMMHAIDPNIRLSVKEAAALGLKSISTNRFYCDEFSKNGKGTDVAKFTQVVGLEPCDATEHIIRQCLKYDKPFDILLCGTPHRALNGQQFQTYQHWFEYLANISSEVNIQKVGGSYYASNVQENQPER